MTKYLQALLFTPLVFLMKALFLLGLLTLAGIMLCFSWIDALKIGYDDKI